MAVLAVAGVLALGACSSGDDDGGASATDAGQSEATTTSAPASVESFMPSEAEVADLVGTQLAVDPESDTQQTQLEYYPNDNFGGPDVQAALGESGFVDAYLRRFGDVNAITGDQIGSAVVNVVQVEDEAQAQAVLDAVVAGVREGNASGGGGTLSPLEDVDDLGDAAQHYTADFSVPPPPITTDFYFWRSGPNVAFAITTAGQPGTGQAEATRALADLVQAKIEGTS